MPSEDLHITNPAYTIATILGEYKNERPGTVEPISSRGRLTNTARTHGTHGVRPVKYVDCFGYVLLFLLMVMVDGTFPQSIADNSTQQPARPRANVSITNCLDQHVQNFESAAVLDETSPKIGRFIVPRWAKAEMTLKLLVHKMDSYKNATEEELLGFMAFAGALVESSLALTNQTELLSALENYKDYDAIHIVGMPEDPYVPPTPLDNRASIDKRTQIAEIVSAGVGQIAGGFIAAYDWVTAFSNRCFQDGFAKRQGGSAISLGTGIPYHVELPYFGIELLPNFLILAVAREGPDKLVETAVMPNKAILGHIANPDHIATLRKPFFKLDKPSWVHSHSDVFQQGPIPLLFGPEESPTIFLPSSGPNSVHAIDDSAAEALEALLQAVAIAETDQFIAKIHLGPGDLLLINNRAVLHSRYSYSSPLFNGKDRIIIRSSYLSSRDKMTWANGCAAPLTTTLAR